jgi:hypothetical protein
LSRWSIIEAVDRATAEVCPGGDPHRRHFERIEIQVWRAAPGCRME